MKSLVEANKGSDNFDIDLKGKIDFNNVILIGHSRSGYEAFEINNIYKDDKRIDIKGVLSIAPAVMGEVKYDLVDNPVSIILPQLDGDVAFLDGQSIFDEMIDNKNRKSEAQLVYLYRANHNAFNEALLIQDEGNIWYTGEPKRLIESNQRKFLVDYSKEFIDSVLNDKFIPNSLNVRDEKLFGVDALVSNYAPGYNLYKAQDGIKNVTSKNISISSEIASYNNEINTAGLFNHPGNNEKLELLNIKWKDNKGEVSFKVNESIKDKDKLSIYLAQDSTDKLNNKENQAFTVTLKDSKGHISDVLLDKNTQALKFVKGTEEFDGKVYSNHTPMNILDIELNKFKDIDINDVQEVILKFDQTKTGSIFLRFISFK